MNRKERRAAQKQGKGAEPFSPREGPAATAGNLFAAAAAQFRAGRLDQAERACRDALALDPHHADSLHLLGMIAFAVGNHDAALELIGRSLARNEHNADCHFNVAQVLRARGRLGEAAQHLAQAGALKPDYVAAHLALADVLMQQGKLGDARARYERALVIEPRHEQAHYGLANLAMRQGRLDEAVARYERALALKPDFAEACNNLGIALAALGRWGDAAAQYRRALALKPDLVDVYRNLGRLMLAQGDAAEALALARRALAVKESEETKAFFAQCVGGLPATAVDCELRGLLARALSEGWSRPSELSAPAAGLFKLGEAGQALLGRNAQDWPDDAVATIAGDPLLRALLEAAPICDLDLERALTGLRKKLLDLALGPAANAADEAAVVLFGALARQCFINEYVFACTEDETRRAGQLRDALAPALQSGATIPALWPIALAAYAPLHTVPQAELLQSRSWPAAVAALLDQQLREPQAERQIRGSIPPLTAIDDAVSLKVQRQYEEMPYPRWVKAAPAGRRVTLDWYLRNQFPLAPIRDGTPHAGIDVLIAGCGSGQHAIETARRFEGARVLAVDLSLTSLSYAKRKTRELSLDNIEYAQADILKLGSLGRSFDLIEASGVLHHLADPAAGWRILLGLLRPGGFMHLGLYSATARAGVNAARAFIAERGYGDSAEEIRRCRQDILAVAGDAPLRSVARFPDFFTISECRDLLFHVEEHHSSIPEIKAFLAENNLTFIGFAGRPALDYRARFPGDKAAADLDLWHAFETENPTVFSGMYQFWVQKA